MINSRNKGHSFEREIANILKEIFPNVRRKLEYNKEDATGIDLQNTGKFKIQCKRSKKTVPMSRIKEIKEKGIHLLISKQDREKNLCTMYLSDFINLIKR